MMTGTMMAVRMHAFGGPDVLRYEEAPRPRAKPGEVLVRVCAVGLNPPDWYLRGGFGALPPEWRPPMTFPIIPGTDVSGIVAQVGDGVEGFAVDDAVYAMVRFPSHLGEGRGPGAYAEYVSMPAAELAPKPAGMTFVQAAAAPMSLLTAWQFLIAVGHDVPNPLQQHRHEPIPLVGKSVLVNGAAGGVGHFAVQLAKWKGARVTAVASGRHEGLLRDLGVDEFIDYGKTAPEAAVRGIDLVLDLVGGPGAGRFLQTLKPRGALFLVYPLGFSDGGEAEKLGVTVSTVQVRSSGAQLAEIGPLLDRGAVRPVIDSTFPLAEARRAHERAAEGHIQGKIVLTVA